MDYYYPSGKIQVFDLMRWIFLWSRNSCFLCRTYSKEYFRAYFDQKHEMEKNDNFWAQSWITTIDDGHFSSLEMGIFYVEYIQRVFYELVWLKKKKISIFLWATKTFFMTLTSSSFN